MTYEPAIVGAAGTAPLRSPHQHIASPAGIVESLVVDLLKEARRQLAQLATSTTGEDTNDETQNRENVRLRAANVQTLANLVEIVRKIVDLQLQLEQMGSVKSARKAGSAREALQRKIARVVAELQTQGVLAVPDG